jgi:hypothetical protein
MKSPNFSKFSNFEKTFAVISVITLTVIASNKLVAIAVGNGIEQTQEIEEVICPNNYRSSGGGYCSPNICITPRGDICSHGPAMLPGQIVKRKIPRANTDAEVDTDRN